MSTVAYILTSLIIFYALIILFLHKASVRFHKMDEKVGNVESAEPTFSNYSIIRDDITKGKKQKEEKKIKEKQEIF